MGGLSRWMMVSALVLLCSASAARAELAEKAVSFPERASATDVVVDDAKLLDPAAVTTITSMSQTLATEHGIPIVVATIDSLSRYGIASDDIATYARALFDEWGIGHANWNRGILLVVAVKDRKARIELGAALAVELPVADGDVDELHNRLRFLD